jgi:hypothetical protein
MTIDAALHKEIFRDEFTDGLRYTGADSPWLLRPAGPLPHGDGVIRPTPTGLEVSSAGTHPRTGAPAFTYLAEPGQDDHIKWSTFARGTAQVPGFPADGPLTLGAVLTARTFGTEDHPFGDAVSDADSDFRLAAAALIVADVGTGLICDFLVTNTAIHAFYERLGSFSYAVPIARRAPQDWHDLAVHYDPAAGSLQWTVDGVPALTVRAIGERCLAEEFLAFDHGGPADPVVPRQLTVGLGMLCQLDDLADRQQRLWGQGVRLSARRITVGR